ncbi:DUF4126 domain-containing protein [Sphingomonas sp.]|uniref:DUF4126 domain-containing protein n=1 Tax=Sphingomonas sp. TaxID=28214 RepID=UPI003B0033CA
MLRALINPFLIGLAGGQRGITPLSVVAAAARRDALPAGAPLRALLANRLVAAGAASLAAAEMAGDKMKTAPDRTVPIGLAVRGVTTAFAGAALAPRGKRIAGAALATATALAAAPLGLRLRKRAMARFGQTATGFVEDALVTAVGHYAGRRRGA